MKLSKAQQAAIDGLKSVIDQARSYETAEDYFNATNNYNCNWNTADKVKAQDMREWEDIEQWWNKKRNGIYLLAVKTETANKLEALGLIQILERPTWKGGYETVKLLNY